MAFRPLSEAHTLAADIPDGLPPAYGDPMATDIIVGQLLENAFKYSPNGGSVNVAARHAGAWIEVSVEDEGIGIAPGDHERIFERFVQGETGDRRRFGGIGLGLYIVRQLARAQGGEVAASSRPGGGTCMRLQLRPAAAEVRAARHVAGPVSSASMDAKTEELRAAHDVLAELYAERLAGVLDRMPIEQAVLGLFCDLTLAAGLDHRGRRVRHRPAPYLAARA